MSKNHKRRLIITLCATILASSLTACAENSKTSSPDSYDKTDTTQTEYNETEKETVPTVSAPTTDTSENTIEKDRYEAQIKYYMELTESLRAELLTIKEEFFIDESEYKQKISSLENTIELLKATVSSLTANADKPQSNIPSTDEMAASISFSYVENNGEITITGYTGKDIDIIIPSNINGFPVTRIGENAFKGSSVRSVVIPSSVKLIDWFAFYGSTCLESITVPSSVTTIEYGAFDYCPASMAVVCPEGSYAEAYTKSRGIRTVTK